MICKITNFLRIFFNRKKKFVKFEFSIYAVNYSVWTLHHNDTPYPTPSRFIVICWYYLLANS